MCRLPSSLALFLSFRVSPVAVCVMAGCVQHRRWSEEKRAYDAYRTSVLGTDPAASSPASMELVRRRQLKRERKEAAVAAAAAAAEQERQRAEEKEELVKTEEVDSADKALQQYGH